MAEKNENENQSPYPLAAGNDHDHACSDEDPAVLAQSEELRRKRRMKYITFIVAFAVFQVGILLLFVFTVLRFRSPKFRVTSGSFETFEVGNVSAPSFNLQMNTQFGVKNTNFGHFKYDVANVTFEYRGTIVGTVFIDEARARARSTRRFNAVVDLKSDILNETSQLSRDIASGKLTLSSYSSLNGKIHLLQTIKKKKSAQMNCTMEVDITTQTLQNIQCK